MAMSREAKALRKSADVFKKSVDPNAIVSKLFSEEMLTREEHSKATQGTDYQRLEEIFKSLERRVSISPIYFHKLVKILKEIPALTRVGEQILGKCVNNGGNVQFYMIVHVRTFLEQIFIGLKTILNQYRVVSPITCITLPNYVDKETVCIHVDAHTCIMYYTFSLCMYNMYMYYIRVLPCCLRMYSIVVYCYSYYKRASIWASDGCATTSFAHGSSSNGRMEICRHPSQGRYS